MTHILNLQDHDTDHDNRWPSTWSFFACASTLSVGAC